MKNKLHVKLTLLEAGKSVLVLGDKGWYDLLRSGNVRANNSDRVALYLLKLDHCIGELRFYP